MHKHVVRLLWRRKVEGGDGTRQKRKKDCTVKSMDMIILMYFCKLCVCMHLGLSLKI